jgi:hypothetical protein
MAETGIPTTFIPHDTVTAVPVRKSGGGGLNDLLLLCGIVLLVASAALAVGVFLYGQFLQTQSASKVVQLQRAEAAFEPSLIEQLTRLDDRMHAGDTLLSAHIAPTVFFQALEQSTLQTVSFKTLDFEAPDAQHITVKMQGVAQSVNSIALQSDLFSKSGVITSPIFSNIAQQSDGVHFDLSAIVNPAAIQYSTLAGSGAPSAPASQTSSAAPAASPFETLQQQTQPAAGAQSSAPDAGQSAPQAASSTQ